MGGITAARQHDVTLRVSKQESEQFNFQQRCPLQTDSENERYPVVARPCYGRLQLREAYMDRRRLSGYTHHDDAEKGSSHGLPGRDRRSISRPTRHPTDKEMSDASDPAHTRSGVLSRS